MAKLAVGPLLQTSKGMKIHLIGDSLSVMTINGKPVTTPGSALAFLLAGQGHTVSVDAVGGFAIQYFRPGAARTKLGMRAAKMIDTAKAAQPDLLLIALGTNDYADSPKALESGIRAIVNAFSTPGVQPTLKWLGPPSFSESAKGGKVKEGTARVYEALEKSLRPVIDTRPLSSDLTMPPLRAGDLIHFSGKGANLYAARMAKAIAGEIIPRRPVALQVGLGEALLVVGLLDILLRGPITKFFSGKKT